MYSNIKLNEITVHWSRLKTVEIFSFSPPAIGGGEEGGFNFKM
jgi:hypothetical protein